MTPITMCMRGFRLKNVKFFNKYASLYPDSPKAIYKESPIGIFCKEPLVHLNFRYLISPGLMRNIHEGLDCLRHVIIIPVQRGLIYHDHVELPGMNNDVA